MDAMIALQQKRLLRVDETARILNVSRWTVYRWVEEGRLGGTRLGAGTLRIFSHTVAALIDHHCVGISAISPAGSGRAVPQTLSTRSVRQVIDGRSARARQGAV